MTNVHIYMYISTTGSMYKPDVDCNNYIYSGPSSIFDDNSYPEEVTLALSLAAQYLNAPSSLHLARSSTPAGITAI